MKNQGQSVAAEAVKQDRESIRDFISMAVHDLREPLRGIRLGAQLLTTKGREPSEGNAARGASFLLDGVERMETLVHDISEYCYEEVREPLARETDLEMALLEAKNELAAELRSAGAKLTQDPLPSVMGNSAALATVFRCLISNACKFRGEESLLIHVAAVQQGPELILSVRDNGAGFDPAYRDRIFRPFERLHGKQFPGSGLGLSLAKNIIEKYGGQIWGESNPGQGSIFSFSFPLAG